MKQSQYGSESICIDAWNITISVIVGERVETALKAAAEDNDCIKELIEVINSEYGEDYLPKASGVFIDGPSDKVIVLSDDVEDEVVYHECFHATIGLLRERGLILSRKSEEAYAYLHGYLTSRVMEIFNEHKQK